MIVVGGHLPRNSNPKKYIKMADQMAQERNKLMIMKTAVKQKQNNFTIVTTDRTEPPHSKTISD